MLCFERHPWWMVNLCQRRVPLWSAIPIVLYIEILTKWLVDVSSMVFRNVENIQLHDGIYDDIPMIFPWLYSTFDDIPMKRRFWLLSFWFFHWGIPDNPHGNCHQLLGDSVVPIFSKKFPEAYVESYWVLAFDPWQSPWISHEIPVFQSWWLCLVLFFLQSLSPNSIPVLKKHRKLMEKIPQYHVISATKAERLDVALQSPSAGVSRQVALRSLQRSERYGDIVLNILSYCMILIDIVQFRWYYIYIYTFCVIWYVEYIYIYNIFIRHTYT